MSRGFNPWFLGLGLNGPSAQRTQSSAPKLRPPMRPVHKVQSPKASCLQCLSVLEGSRRWFLSSEVFVKDHGFKQVFRMFVQSSSMASVISFKMWAAVSDLKDVFLPRSWRTGN